MHYDETQETWLETVLADAKSNGYNVICINHYPPQKGIDAYDCNFASFVSSISGESQEERLPDSAYDVVDDFIEGGGKFVCWLSGHTHYDYFGTVNNHSNQIDITIENAGTNGTYNDGRRVRGTKTQDNFSIVGFDFTNKLISLVRIGTNTDRHLRPKHRICISYNTKEVLSYS